MQIADKYAPQEIEQKWYDYWERHGLFHSEPDAREPYTVVIPPLIMKSVSFNTLKPCRA